MGILIEVNTETLSGHEATALVAFFQSFAPGDARQAAPAAPAAVQHTPQSAADALMKAESARVAAGAPPLAPPAPGVGKAPPPPPASGAPAAASAPSPAPAASPGAAGAASGDGYTGPWPRTLATGVQVDSEGLPWDKRIHSSAKGVMKGGQWKLARNLDKDFVESVRAELMAVMNAAPGVPMATPMAPPAPAPGAVPPASSVPVAPTPSPAPAGAGGADYGHCTFPDLMGRVVDLSMNGTDPAAVAAICAEFGLTQPRDFANRPDMVPAMMARLAAFGE